MPTAKKKEPVSDLRQLINNRQTKTVNFMREKIVINRLTLAECTEIQRLARELETENPDKAFDLLKHVIRVGVPAADDFNDEDFENFPMADLNSLSDEVLRYAGMDPNKH